MESCESAPSAAMAFALISALRRLPRSWLRCLFVGGCCDFFEEKQKAVRACQWLRAAAQRLAQEDR